MSKLWPYVYQDTGVSGMEVQAIVTALTCDCCEEYYEPIEAELVSQDEIRAMAIAHCREFHSEWSLCGLFSEACQGIEWLDEVMGGLWKSKVEPCLHCAECYRKACGDFSDDEIDSVTMVFDYIPPDAAEIEAGKNPKQERGDSEFMAAPVDASLLRWR